MLGDVLTFAAYFSPENADLPMSNCVMAEGVGFEPTVQDPVADEPPNRHRSVPLIERDRALELRSTPARASRPGS
jgi:hypothetical protein